MDYGFVVSKETSTVIMVIFAIYSLLICGLGLYTMYASRKLSASDKIANWLVGGGNLGPFAVCMIGVTNLLSAGAMIGNAGLVYSSGGYIVSVSIITNTYCVFYLLGTLGKKMAIVRARTGMESVCGILRSRFNSKTLSMVAALIMAFFLTMNLSSQFMGGAKFFAILSGSNSYYIGMVLIAAVTIIYTACGGIKSMARIAVLQGMLMMFSCTFMFIVMYRSLGQKYGSFEQGMYWIATNSDLFMPSKYTFMQALGTAFSISLASTVMPYSVVTTLTYKKASTVRRAFILSMIACPFISVVLTNAAVFTMGINPSLASGDYVTAYIAGVMSPKIIGALVLCGTAAAIQSSCASYILIAVTSLVKDMYQGILKPEVSNEKVSKLMPIWTVIIGVIGLIIAFRPIDLISIINLFSMSGLCCGLFFPLVFGLHSKKVTPKGAVWSAFSGVVTYITFFLLQRGAVTGAVYRSLGNIHPIFFGLVVSGLVMYFVSKHTPQVELGVLQVWFGKTYDPEYAKQLNGK